MSKIDVKSAYRRVSLSALLAAMCITKVNDNAFLMLRITFSGTNGPFDWPDIINEPATDLFNGLNDILSYSVWDEKILFSPIAIR